MVKSSSTPLPRRPCFCLHFHAKSRRARQKRALFYKLNLRLLFQRLSGAGYGGGDESWRGLLDRNFV